MSVLAVYRNLCRFLQIRVEVPRHPLVAARSLRSKLPKRIFELAATGGEPTKFFENRMVIDSHQIVRELDKSNIELKFVDIVCCC